jgi:hypothetical protein
MPSSYAIASISVLFRTGPLNPVPMRAQVPTVQSYSTGSVINRSLFAVKRSKSRDRYQTLTRKSVKTLPGVGLAVVGRMWDELRDDEGERLKT